MTSPNDVLCVGDGPYARAVAEALDETTISDVNRVEAALDRLEESAVGCLVVDHDPDGGLDAAHVVERLRAGGVETPVVVYTDDGDESLAGAVVAAGADAYVPAADGPETLRKRVTAALDGTHSTRRGAFDRSPLAVVEWTADGRIVEWNDEAEALFGYPRDAVLGDRIDDYLVPDGAHVTPEDAATPSNGESATSDYEWPAAYEEAGETRTVVQTVRDDGRSVTCEWYSVPVYEDDEIRRVVSFARDVTDEVRRAQTLELLKETTRDLVHATDERTIAEVAVSAARDILDQPMASIRLYDEEKDALVAVAATDRSLSVLGDLPPVGPGDEVLWSAYEKRERRVYSQVPLDRTYLAQDAPVRSAVVEPLGEYGLLVLASTDDDGFTESDTHLANLLAATTETALERARHERALERRRLMVQAAGDGVYVLDADGYHRMVNDRHAELTGYPREAVVGEHASMFLSEEDTERGERHIREMLEGDEDVRTYELTVQCADGTTFPAEVNMSLLRSNGEFQGTVGVIRDISERRDIEQKLRDRKEKIENLHDVAARLEECRDEGDVWETAVHAAEGVLHFDECGVDKVVGDNLVAQATSSEVLPDGYVERTPITDGLAGKTYRTGETYRVDDLQTDEDANPEDDSYRSLLSVPINHHGVFQAVSSERAAFDENDEDLAELLMTHVANALGRVQFESELRSQRDRFAGLFENVPDAVVDAEHHSDETTVQAVNPAFERVFGYPESELLGRDVDDFVVPNDRRDEATDIDARARAGEVVETEVKRRTSDGLRDFLLKVVPIDVGGDNPRTFAVYTDITERKQRQQRVEVLNRVLRHDLRNGMNIITGSAEMLKDVAPEEYRQYAETIDERATELVEMAEKTRAVERSLDTDDREVWSIDVVESVTSAFETLQPEYPEATFRIDAPDAACVKADDLLDAAIYHVVENACDHSDVTPEVTFRVTDETADEGSLVVEIADNGPGIPQEERELITEEREITQLRHASGLGLWLVNWVVTQAGGSLSFEENEPRGTVVRMQLPAARREN